MTSSPLLSRPGAVREEGGAVAAHYGDPLREQRLLAEGAGLVDRSDRDVLAVPGADRLSWLHSLTSQHLERLADGTGTEALVLSPHGHVEHHLVLTDLDGTTWADVEPGTLGEQPLLAQRVAVVGSDRTALLLHGAGAREERRAGHEDSDRSRHARHVPDRATCPTSTVKPRSAARRSAALSSRSGAAEEISPQDWQTTCRWGCSAAW